MAKTYMKLDGNLIPIFLGAKVVSETTSETWVINESPALSNVAIYEDITFTSNNISFSQITILGGYQPSSFILRYDDTLLYGFDTAFEWINQAYRTVTFETAPTGDLLTWLQTNAVKQ